MTASGVRTMGTLEKITELIVTERQAAEFLRELADKFDGTPIKEENWPGADLTHFKKIKINIEKERGRIFLAVKIKSADQPKAGLSENKTGKQSDYKKLKKRMKNTFKEICRYLSDGVLPSAKMMEAFFRDSELMVTYPNCGNEYYAEYKKCCAEFQNAFERSDLAACRIKSEEISQIKSDCHRKYK
jgi:XXXCH domain-containing protein